MFDLLCMITDWCQTKENTENCNFDMTYRQSVLESRKIFDRIAKNILLNEIDNAIIIDALLKLSKMERIIVILNILNEIEIIEIAYLLGTNVNSIYVQKNSALQRLRKAFIGHFHYGLIEYKEANKNDAKKQTNH